MRHIGKSIPQKIQATRVFKVARSLARYGCCKN
jgi:hypothetical protein